MLQAPETVPKIRSKEKNRKEEHEHLLIAKRQRTIYKQYMAEMNRVVRTRNLKSVKNIEGHGETFKTWVVRVMAWHRCVMNWLKKGEISKGKTSKEKLL